MNKNIYQNIESELYDDKGMTFTSVTGKKLYISKYDLDLVSKLRELPADDRILVMGLTAQDIEAYLTKYIKGLNKQVSIIFSKKWLDKINGDPFSFDNADSNKQIFGIPMTDKEILKATKKGKLRIEIATQIIEYFESFECEFYTIEEPII